MGTERNKCGDLTDTDVYKMATPPFGHRAKDCCVIIDTGVKKNGNIYIWVQSQRLLCHH